MKEPVGTELAKLIPDWAVQFKHGCGCRDMQKKMDKWGVEGCIENKHHILAHLERQSGNLIPAFRLIPKPVRKIVAQKLLKAAIRNAQA